MPRAGRHGWSVATPSRSHTKTARGRSENWQGANAVQGGKLTHKGAKCPRTGARPQAAPVKRRLARGSGGGGGGEEVARQAPRGAARGGASPDRCVHAGASSCASRSSSWVRAAHGIELSRGQAPRPAPLASSRLRRLAQWLDDPAREKPGCGGLLTGWTIPRASSRPSIWSASSWKMTCSAIASAASSRPSRCRLRTISPAIPGTKFGEPGFGTGCFSMVIETPAIRSTCATVVPPLPISVPTRVFGIWIVRFDRPGPDGRDAGSVMGAMLLPTFPRPRAPALFACGK
mmetsp:Transcript_16077/g.37203  ORF Transcript_16077/g.37203 Transcript_16077/m.37203 type:complete len:289 (-) Transcript_16077:205-1071(-)